MRFEAASFQLSVFDSGELPASGRPEVAFIGRSNAGKSSALNALAGRRRLAFVSKIPGRTQLINFFSLGEEAFLVDLPGYGYAGVPANVKKHWEFLVGGYLCNRESLAGVLVVMDCRHPLAPPDRIFLEWLTPMKRRIHVLLSKADKVSDQVAKRTLASTRRSLQEICPSATIQLFSSPRRVGLEEAKNCIESWIKQDTK